MARLNLSDAATSIGAVVQGADQPLAGFSIDSRTLQKGDVYIAIRGDRFDGHDFVDAAIANGASAVLVERSMDADVSQLIVSDTRVALTELSRFWAAEHRVPTVAITGSNGKTTIKEMVASILSEVGPVLSTKGNFNNDIGVPLTLLRLSDEHQYAVIEMGANHLGEIAHLTNLVQPDVAVLSNVGPAHIEGFGSLEAIAAAKSEIFQGVQPDGFSVINAMDSFSYMFREQAKNTQVRTFGLEDDCSVFLKGRNPLDLHVGEQCHPLSLKLLGEHNELNAMAAAAAADCLGVGIEKIIRGLEKLEAVPGRLQLKHSPSGVAIIDDSYNANPASAGVAIKVLKNQSGVKILVLGDMLELGANADRLHADVGSQAESAGIDHVFTVGDLSQHAADAHKAGVHFSDQQALLSHLQSLLAEQSAAAVLVKGSRGSSMEIIVQRLVELDSAVHNDLAGAAS